MLLVFLLAEAAEHLHRLLEGARTSVALCRPPMVLPQVAQNTTPGEPLGDVRARCEELMRSPVWNVSLFGGFSLADVPDCGFSAVVTADADAPQSAASAAADVAGLASSAQCEAGSCISHHRPSTLGFPSRTS